MMLAGRFGATRARRNETTTGRRGGFAIEDAVCTNPMAGAPDAERILLIRLGAVGDVVRTLPAASLLRRSFPDRHVTWLVEPAAESAVRGQPWVDDVLVFPRPGRGERGRYFDPRRAAAAARRLREFWRDLRGGRFDLVIDFHAILKSGLFSWMSRAPTRVTYAPPYAREGAWRFATHRAELSVTHTSRFARNEALARFVAASADSAPHPFVVSEEAKHFAVNFLAGDAPFVIHPGTSAHTRHKRWSETRYAEVARVLEADTGLRSIVTYGAAPAELASAQRVVSRAAGAARLAPRTKTLQELAALLEAATAYIGSDTGPLHVASLVGTPVVQILGPTDPVENRPYPGTPFQSIRVPVVCSPCRRGCSAATCIQQVSSDRVVKAAKELLAAANPGW